MAKKSNKQLKPVKQETKEVQTRGPVRRVTLEVNTGRLEENVQAFVRRVQYWYKQGLINKVRLKYRGKAILPDIPLSYFMLAQVATFFLAGVIRALAISVGTRVFFEVEMINDAEELLKKAKNMYLDGDLEEASLLLQEVLKLDPHYAEAHLYLGIIEKIRGDRSAASKHFLQAHKLDPSGKVGIEANKNMKKLSPPTSDTE